MSLNIIWKANAPGLPCEKKDGGEVYEPGKALSEPLRKEIIEMYDEGLSLTDISNDVKVTVRGVNKIINCHGGSGADVVTDDVLHFIEIWKRQRPSIYAREIQKDFCLKGYVTEINFYQYRRLIGVSAEN